MHTIYGIYEHRKRTPLYIGITSLPLWQRFNGHIGTGRRIHKRPRSGNGDTVRLYGQWMHDHSTGKVRLCIRPIATAPNSSDGLDMERKLILQHKPILNTRAIRPSPNADRSRERHRRLLAMVNAEFELKAA